MSAPIEGGDGRTSSSSSKVSCADRDVYDIPNSRAVHITAGLVFSFTLICSTDCRYHR